MINTTIFPTCFYLIILQVEWLFVGFFLKYKQQFCCKKCMQYFTGSLLLFSRFILSTRITRGEEVIFNADKFSLIHTYNVLYSQGNILVVTKSCLKYLLKNRFYRIFISQLIITDIIGTFSCSVDGRWVTCPKTILSFKATLN